MIARPALCILALAMTAAALPGRAAEPSAATAPRASEAEAGAAQPVEAKTQSPRSFEDSVAAFVANYYLSGDSETDDEIARTYAETVDYFDHRSWPRSSVTADKMAYTARWPKRAYHLLRETLVIVPQPGAHKVYDVRFAYEFDVAGPGRRSRGRGQALLTLDLAHDGGHITRETGTVTARW